MSLSFNELKKSRKASLEKLSAELEKLTKKKDSSEEEGKFWKPTIGPDGNGFAIIRFLPAPKGEDIPWSKKWHYGFRGPTGAWYIETSLSTINQRDPCGEYNSHLWNLGPEGQKQASAQKRKLTYYSNILVVKDPEHPENEGKVFVYRYGQKIWDKIQSQIMPSEYDEPCDPFDLWEGKNFKIKVKTVKVKNPNTGQEDKFPNYDSSEWAEKSAVSKDDVKLEEIWNSCYPLKSFVETKTYEELEATLTKVMGMEHTGLPTSKNRKTNVAAPKAEAPALKSKEEETPPFDIDDGGDEMSVEELFAELKTS